ncbi:flavoprotein, partial [Peziza echinospora]
PQPPTHHFLAEQHITPGKKHLLLACTGSIATIKLPDILTALHPHRAHLTIQLIITRSALNFLPAHLLTPTPAQALSTAYPGLVQHVWLDADEWTQWRHIGDPVLHIELRKWADELLIAPLSADFMAKMVGGIVDGLLGGVVRAWDTQKRLVVAPAMNTLMWEHPVTESQLEVLHGWGWVVIWMPVEKTLACGDVGTGAMVEWRDIVGRVVRGLPVGAGGVGVGGSAEQ